MNAEYQEFLQSKLANVQLSGFEVEDSDINPMLFKFQNACVRWALRLGKAALFEECGLGKTFQQIEWARLVARQTGGKVIILAPLAVAGQTVLEAKKLGVNLKYVLDQSEVDTDLVISNYDRLHLFDTTQFHGVVLDESSILKAFMGKTKQALFEAFQSTPYKLCCTATPAPNDHLELGNHAAFLDVMPANEMISRWFINDAMEAGNYRLKKHAASDFWRWLTSWAVCLSMPKDIGDEYDEPDFVLPPLNVIEVRLAAAQASIDRAWAEGRLMPDDSPSSTGMHKVKRESLADRINEVKRIVATIPTNEPILIWCDTDYEADALVEELPEAVEVRGGTKDKESKLLRFASNEFSILITKPSIAGFGLNYQHCANQILVGVSYSFEKFYQAIRRSWRFGQTNPVNVYAIYAETEGNIMTILNHKQEQFKEMQVAMSKAVKTHGLFRDTKKLALTVPDEKLAHGDSWQLYLGDCVEQIKKIPDNSIHLGIHSPPFSNLYIYSDSEADMGNSNDDEEFFKHYEFLIEELYRTTMPGRLCVVHCKDLPSYMNRDGAAGLVDFPGRVIKAFESKGWQYHSRVTIWKDPVIEMQRTKNHGLLHKNFASMAEACRQGMPDYLVVFRKYPLEGGVPVVQKREVGDYIGTEPPPVHMTNQRDYSIAVWQRYASPVWMDIDQTDVLNFKLGRNGEDERHICPLQLGVIERCVDLWSNKGETVFSPFAGVGSELVTAIKMNRKAVGIELKESYFKTAVKFLKEAEQVANLPSLFDLLPTQ
jgi:DNA modification methylase